MKAWKIIVAVFSSLVGLVAVGILVGGVFLSWAYGTQRDDDGFLTSPTYEMDADGYAIVSGAIDLGSKPGDWFPSGFATVRIEAASGVDTFVGIGPSEDVHLYLDGVALAEVTHVGDNPDDFRLVDETGRAPAAPPGEQAFWVASAEGDGARLEWDVEGGEWTAVVMNADASEGVGILLTAAGRRRFQGGRDHGPPGLAPGR